jgi:hypothetical protein
VVAAEALEAAAAVLPAVETQMAGGAPSAALPAVETLMAGAASAAAVPVAVTAAGVPAKQGAQLREQKLEMPWPLQLPHLRA